MVKKLHLIKYSSLLLAGIFIDRYFMKKICVQEDDLYRDTIKYMNQITNESNRIIKKWNILTALALERVDIDSILKEKGCTNLAIYGLGEIGEYVIAKFFLSEKIKVAYIIDKNKAGGFYKNIPIYGLNEDLPETEMIIVTTVMNFTEIRYQLFRKTQAQIVSIENIMQ